METVDLTDPAGDPLRAWPGADRAVILRGPDADASTLRELSFDESGVAVLTAAVKAAPRLGHNDICTRHLLLGVLEPGGPPPRRPPPSA